MTSMGGAQMVSSISKAVAMLSSSISQRRMSLKFSDYKTKRYSA